MSVRVKIGCLVVLLAASFLSARADNRRHLCEFGIEGGCGYYIGDATSLPFQHVREAYGVNFRYRFDQRWALMVKGLAHRIMGGFPEKTGAGDQLWSNQLVNIDVDAEFNFFRFGAKTYDKRVKPITPYILCGVGMCLPLTSTDGNKKPFYLTDTVGFVSDLPSGLVEAFHSTLEEVKFADLLLQVVDCSDEHYKDQMKITEETLKEIDASDIPMVTVYNKADRTEFAFPVSKENYVRISARDEESIRMLIDYITAKVYPDFHKCDFLFPYQESKKASYLMDHGTVLDKKYEEDGVYITAEVSLKVSEQLKEFICKP